MNLLRIAASLFAVLAPGIAAAQSARTFVSGNGSDSNPCTVAAPCRSFAQALNVTNAGGEILVLDTAGYGTLTINKAVSIVAPAGIYGGITVPSGGTGITIPYGSGNVVLRGLTINGGGVGATGISISTSNKVEVYDCVISGMSQNGVSIGSNGTTLIVDTTVSRNGAAAVYMRASSAGGSNALTMSRVTLANSDKGFQLIAASNGYGYVTIDSSMVTENSTGLYLTTDTGTGAGTVFSTSTALHNNTSSFVVGAGASLTLEKTSARSQYADSTNNGTIISFGDNAIVDTVNGNAFVSRALK